MLQRALIHSYWHLLERELGPQLIDICCKTIANWPSKSDLFSCNAHIEPFIKCYRGTEYFTCVTLLLRSQFAQQFRIFEDNVQDVVSSPQFEVFTKMWLALWNIPSADAALSGLGRPVFPRHRPAQSLINWPETFPAYFLVTYLCGMGECLTMSDIKQPRCVVF